MKTTLISSALSLAIGFTFGWLIKSASADLDSFVPQAGQNTHTPRPPTPSPDSTPKRVLPKRPSSVDPTHAPPIGTVPGEPTRVDRAKWMRLIEVLGLNPDQAKALEAAMAESLPNLETGKSPEVSYIEAGALLEKKILAILDADQRKAFADMQRRAMDSRIELSAQQTYMQDLGELDLMPEQRIKALDLLRDRAEQLSADIPSSARLLLTGSILPVSERNFSEDAIRLLR